MPFTTCYVSSNLRTLLLEMSAFFSALDEHDGDEGQAPLADACEENDKKKGKKTRAPRGKAYGKMMNMVDLLDLLCAY
jgi:hypothetical protein